MHSLGKLTKSLLFKFAKKGCRKGNQCGFNHQLLLDWKKFHQKDPPRSIQNEWNEAKHDWQGALKQVRDKIGADGGGGKKSDGGGGASDGGGQPPKSPKVTPKKTLAPKRGHALPAAQADSKEEREKAKDRLKSRTVNVPAMPCTAFADGKCPYEADKCFHGKHIPPSQWMKHALGTMRGQAKDLILSGVVKNTKAP